MDDQLAQQSIDAALKGNWEKAKALNEQIVNNYPKDVDALNRLAKANAELGNLKKARGIAKKALKIDPFNSIAKKSLKKWKGLKKINSSGTAPKTTQFLEEPGKTKIITLLHPGDPDLLAQLDSGDQVEINTNGHRVTTTTNDGKYIGKLADDLSSRIKKLIKYGNQYEAYIKSVEDNKVKVFIKETKRSQRLSDIPSFSSEKIEYIAFTPPELVHKKEDIDLGNEDGE